MNDDTISRAAAIEAVHKNDHYTTIKQRLDDLPSVQPLVKDSPSLVKDLVKDCISRQKAIDRINKQREHLQPDIYPQDKIGDAAYRICAEFIERLPSVQPEIIHCRDCKHFGTDKYKKLTWCGRKDYGYGWGKNDFCSKAERRTDERSD